MNILTQKSSFYCLNLKICYLFYITSNDLKEMLQMCGLRKDDLLMKYICVAASRHVVSVFVCKMFYTSTGIYAARPKWPSAILLNCVPGKQLGGGLQLEEGIGFTFYIRPSCTTRPQNRPRTTTKKAIYLHVIFTHSANAFVAHRAVGE